MTPGKRKTFVKTVSIASVPTGMFLKNNKKKKQTHDYLFNRIRVLYIKVISLFLRLINNLSFRIIKFVATVLTYIFWVFLFLIEILILSHFGQTLEKS